MKGIGGRPYIDCAEFLDMDALASMDLEICSGIALSSPKAGVYGPGVKDSHKFNNFLNLKGKLSGDPKEMEYRWNKMTHDQQNVFAKLYLKLYNPSTVVYLRQPKKGLDPIAAYLKKSSADHFDWTQNIQHFPTLVPWLQSLEGPVFESYGRVLFFIHEHDCKLLIHRDGLSYMPHKSEFLWLNPGGTKKFFIYDETTDSRHYVDSTAAFFNDLDMHGGDPTEYASWSLRIDGRFSAEFREKIGVSHLSSY